MTSPSQSTRTFRIVSCQSISVCTPMLLHSVAPHCKAGTRCVGYADAAAPATGADVSEGDLDAAMRGAEDDDDAAAADAQAAEAAAEAAEFNAEVPL